jgi:purine-nucleoside/S-methyl-5'-thioadenosine phosphorylase / adenosine deaminase
MDRGTIREIPASGPVPRFEVPGWAEEYGVVAGITARGGEPGRGFDLGLWSKEPVGEVMDRWLAFRRALGGFDAVVLGNQIHGVEVMRLDSGHGWIQIQGIDGWITTKPGILLTITIADCVPVYLVVPGRAIALLHAGWRGTAGGILKRGIGDLITAANSSPTEIVMHCGIGICGDCYEVGSEVMAGCEMPAKGPGPWHLDLRTRLMDQGRYLGLTKITTSAWCSAHDRPTFYSHRASGGADGRMVAYLGIARLASPSHLR